MPPNSPGINKSLSIQPLSRLIGGAAEGSVSAPGRRSPLGSHYPRLKRFMDVGGALLLGLLLTPVWAAAAAATFASGAPSVLFRQQRVGRGGKPFAMLKFCTMKQTGGSEDAPTAELRDSFLAELSEAATPDAMTGLFKQDTSGRITVPGRFLRRYSIDEIPQLINVIRGDMSLVGPRPALVWEAELFTPAQQKRHDVRPGLTGLWQVSGRNALSTGQMLALDLQYVEQQSLRLDLEILFRTPRSVLMDRNTR